MFGIDEPLDGDDDATGSPSPQPRGRRMSWSAANDLSMAQLSSGASPTAKESTVSQQFIRHSHDHAHSSSSLHLGEEKGVRPTTATKLFEDTIRSKLDEVFESITHEYKREHVRIEARLHALEADNRRLRRQEREHDRTHTHSTHRVPSKEKPSSSTNNYVVAVSDGERGVRVGGSLTSSGSDYLLVPIPGGNCSVSEGGRSVSKQSKAVSSAWASETPTGKTPSSENAQAKHEGEKNEGVVKSEHRDSEKSADSNAIQSFVKDGEQNEFGVHEDDGSSEQSSVSKSQSASSPRNFELLDTWQLSKARIQMNYGKAGTKKLEDNKKKEQQTDEEESESMVWVDQKLQKYVLQPGAAKRLTWEFVGLLAISYEVIMIPMQVLDVPGNIVSNLATWFIRIFWTMDIFFSFFTGYHCQRAEGNVELRPSLVARRYARTRLPLDVVIVGCDWLEIGLDSNLHSDSAALQLAGMLRAIRIFRLARVAKARNITDFFLQHIRSEGHLIAVYAVFIVLLLIVLIHVIACAWFAVQTRQWGGGSLASRMKALDKSYAERYVESFHFVLALFVGEHITLPESPVQRVFTVVVLLFAFVVTASFVGSLTTAMTRLQIIASQRSAQFASLNRYLNDCRISRRLCVRVQRNARHALHERKRNTPASQVELLKIISEPLRAEINYEVYSHHLIRHPFFKLYNKHNATGIKHICHTGILEVSLSRGDVLFSEFETPVVPKMYFVQSGKLTYAQGLVLQTPVVARQWLAEPSLWTTWAHRGTLTTRTECRLLAVDANRFVNIVTTYPTLHAHVYGEKFLDHLNLLDDTDKLTDIGHDSDNSRSLVYSAFMEADGTTEMPAEWQRRRSTHISVVPHDSSGSGSASRRQSVQSSASVVSSMSVKSRASNFRNSVANLAVPLFSFTGLRRFSGSSN